MLDFLLQILLLPGYNLIILQAIKPQRLLVLITLQLQVYHPRILISTIKKDSEQPHHKGNTIDTRLFRVASQGHGFQL